MDNEEIIREHQKIYDLAKSNKHRIDELEERQGELDKLVSAVAVIAEEQKDMKEDMAEIKNDMKTDMAEIKQDVKAITEKPGKRWESVTEKLLLTAIGILVAYLFTRIGIG